MDLIKKFNHQCCPCAAFRISDLDNTRRALERERDFGLALERERDFGLALERERERFLAGELEEGPHLSISAPRVNLEVLVYFFEHFFLNAFVLGHGLLRLGPHTFAFERRRGGERDRVLRLTGVSQCCDGERDRDFFLERVLRLTGVLERERERVFFLERVLRLTGD